MLELVLKYYLTTSKKKSKQKIIVLYNLLVQINYLSNQFKTKSNSTYVMETVKKERSNQARTLTWRLKELYNSVKNNVSEIEVKEKISTVKYTFEELGDIQDKLLGVISEDDVATYTTNVKWYEDYDEKMNIGISNARIYIRQLLRNDNAELPVKITKLSMPVFESEPKKYRKWINTFERYTNTLNSEIKYDYLLANTKGKANDLISNRGTYKEAIESLEKEFGNKHVIMSLLIDEIKSLPVVRKGDFKAFERLSYEANAFRDRL